MYVIPAISQLLTMRCVLYFSYITFVIIPPQREMFVYLSVRPNVCLLVWVQNIDNFVLRNLSIVSPGWVSGDRVGLMTWWL